MLNSCTSQERGSLILVCLSQGNDLFFLKFVSLLQVAFTPICFRVLESLLLCLQIMI